MPVRRRKSLGDYPCPWEPRPVSQERWERHRERMLAHMPAGTRPEEWWEYDSPLYRHPDRAVRECRQLYEMGELSDEELTELLVWWRLAYDKAQDPVFTYCAGPGRFLKGVAARKSLYDWAGIPPDLARQWNEERFQRERSIRSTRLATA